ncbi:MAG: peptide chain release factor N(5)-glutamine methyltransferase [Candidatus Kapabacteria bacterium]|nr:peptide chain release factor N(5)-glutamine methyltransferase [Candidatus Kapabacteria bacterium]
MKTVNGGEWTVLDIIRWTTNHFTTHNIDSPRLTVELMLCDVLNCERLSLYMNYERPLTDTERAALRSMVERRVRHREPLQYILGHTEFYGYRFHVNPSVLIPRPETEYLVEHALTHIRTIQSVTNPTVLDIGTGSGCIAIAIAKSEPRCTLTAVDISAAALDVAMTNAARNSVSSVTFRQLDICTNHTFADPFDVVVSNPPYIGTNGMGELEPELLNHEPHSALTDTQDGLTFYRHYARILRTITKRGGRFYFEFGYGQEQDIRSIFRDYNHTIINDFAGIPRIITGEV